MACDSIQLSIGVPTFNQAEYIGATLDSLLAQTDAPFEVVVSENHCTDHTPQILERFGSRIRVVRPPEHLPMAESWNYLLSQLRGNWFAMLSSDDLALPNFVATLTRLAASVSDAVLVRGGYQVIDGRGVVEKTKRFRDDRPVLRYPATLLQQLRGPHTSFSAFAARTDACREAGGFIREDGFAGDWSMWIRLSPLGAFVYTPEVFSQYRVGYRSEEAERGRYMNFLRTQPRIYREVIPDVIARHGGIPISEVAKMSHARCHAFLAWGSRALPPGERAAAVDEIRSWAEECGLADELESFASGGSIDRTQRSRPAAVLRRLGRRLRSLAGRRRRDYARSEL